MSPTTVVEPATPPPADQMIPIRDAAAMLGVSVSTLRYWRTNRIPGRPHGVKIGGGVRYSTARLREWIAQQIADSGSEV